MNREQAIVACMANGELRRAECAELVDASMVDGSYCDGSIYIDEHGRRCISRADLDRRAAAAAASPVATRPEDRPLPTPGWAVPLTLSLSVRALFALADVLDVR